MTCDKIAYPSEHRAREVINLAYKKYARKQRHNNLPTRAYYCKECGYWHLTSQPDKKELKKFLER